MVITILSGRVLGDEVVEVDKIIVNETNVVESNVDLVDT